LHPPPPTTILRTHSLTHSLQCILSALSLRSLAHSLTHSPQQHSSSSSKMDKGMLTDATSTDDSPTPGYMLSEISREYCHHCTASLTHSPTHSPTLSLTHSGATVASYAACTQLIDFLNVRLKKNNHNVKHKCCLIIKVSV
jgi:hypothetical protein